MADSLLRYFHLNHPQSVMLNAAIDAMQSVRRSVEVSIKNGRGIEHSTFQAADGTWKDMLQVDKEAENICATHLLETLGGQGELLVLGEETLWKLPTNLDLSCQKVYVQAPNDPKVEGGAEKRITAILDMIDGSDLLERRLGNWCSAMVFLDPRRPKILFSLVQDSTGVIYGADESSTFLITPDRKPGDTLPPLEGVEIREILKAEPNSRGKRPRAQTGQIAVCYYNQKVSHFQSTTPLGLADWLTTLPEEEQNRFRIYTLAGNPMMVRMANSENIHAVFEHIGQYPHDVVPGAYIALRAGGHMCDFEGAPILEEVLAKLLLNPSGPRIKYVLASTDAVAIDIAGALKQRQAKDARAARTY
jgi:hypothetical protein